MKTVFVLILAFSSVLAVTKEQFKEDFKKANEKCNEDPATTLLKEDLKNWHEHSGPEPANLGAHALCLSKALGWQNASGKLQVKLLKTGIREHAESTEKADKIISRCVVEKENDIETAKHLLKCFTFVTRKHHEKH